MEVVSSFYITQFKYITTVMKDAEIPFKTERFMNGNTQAFNLLVDAENLEIARKLAIQVEFSISNN
ncbi:hypothetical protein [Lyngbya aestuarii]|nr:hypothetical protein [Lyngbya aestuarii]